MSDKPEDRPEERRRTGPLGDDAESTETRREPPAEADAEATRRVPSQRPEQGPPRETERAPQRPSGEEEDKETRVIRTPGGYGTAQDATPYPRG